MAQQQHQYPAPPPQTTPYPTTLPPQQQPPPPNFQQYPPQPPPYLHHPPPQQQPPPPPYYPYPYPHHNPFPYDYPYHHHPPPPPPPPPQQYPPPPPYPRRRQPSAKRRREPLDNAGCGGGVEEGGLVDEDGPTSKRQAVVGNGVLFRVVVPSGEIGKVIGKGGYRVQKIRDDSKATIKIADPIARFEERIIIISSKEKSDGGMTDAEKALLQIASLILVEDGSSGQSRAADDAYGLTPNAVKLLIAGSQASSLIGVSGQNIEKLRMSSGAAIAILAPTQLPMCTSSAHESDRLVQISGETSEVLKALEEIGVELRANPPKQVISISPTYNLSITRSAQPYMDPNAAECVTLDMVISETMVGGLIGKSGSNIGRIRNESGAMIKGNVMGEVEGVLRMGLGDRSRDRKKGLNYWKEWSKLAQVFGGKGEQKHRQIQLIGSSEQVALAKQRVDEYVYTQLTQPSSDD